MDFAVIKLAGKQHLVKAEDVISVDADLGKVGDKLDLSEVLLTNISDKLEIGTPLVAGAKALGEIVFSGKGVKLHISKFKAKSRYRKTIGFRPNLTKIKILSIGNKPVIASVAKQSSSPVKKTPIVKKSK